MKEHCRKLVEDSTGEENDGMSANNYLILIEVLLNEIDKFEKEKIELATECHRIRRSI